jgi:hypothetical protein
MGPAGDGSGRLETWDAGKHLKESSDLRRQN